MGVKSERLRQNCFSFPVGFFYFSFSSCSVQNSDLIGLTVLALWHVHTRRFFITDLPSLELLFQNEMSKFLRLKYSYSDQMKWSENGL